MSLELTEQTSAPSAPVARARLRSAVRDLAVVVVAFLVAGALSGVLWKSLWHAPPGVAYHHRWYLQTEGLPRDFSGTGLFVVVSLAVGLVVAAVLALVVERDELVTGAGVLVGSALASWTMYVVGHRLGPPDPHALAAHAQDLDPIPSDLVIAGHGWTVHALGVHWHLLPASPFLAFPLGAVIGLSLVYFVFTRRGSNAPLRGSA